MHSKVLIIGSGPAGYTAAIYAARAMLEPTLVQGLQPGGQLTITTDVENYPGYGDVIQGPWLMEQMQEQAKNVGTNIINDIIKSVDFKSKPFKAISESGTEYTADSVIISTGAQARWLGLDSEKKFQGYGVSACATCDGFFFKEKKVAVIGGFKNEKVECVWDSELKEIVGDDDPLNVKSINIKNTKTNETSSIELDGVFVAIGHDPATQIFRDQVEMDEDGYIITKPDSTLTNVEGVYAAGDVKDKIYRQAVTAAGMGCMAALEAEKYLAELS